MRLDMGNPGSVGEGRVTSVRIPITDIAAHLGHDCPSHRTTRDLGPVDGFQDRSPVTLSCRSFAANAVRLQLHALAYNFGNFLRTLATPEPIKDWSLTSLKEKLIKIGAKVVAHGRYVAFQMAEVAVPRMLFAEILRLIADLRPRSPPLPARASRATIDGNPSAEVCS